MLRLISRLNIVFWLCLSPFIGFINAMIPSVVIVVILAIIDGYMQGQQDRMNRKDDTI